MSLRSLSLAAALVVTLLSIGASTAGAASPLPCPRDRACTPIRHVVFIVKENRTFDSMFGTFPGANGARTFTDPTGHVRPLLHQPDTLLNDLSHRPDDLRLAEDNGKMDRFGQLSIAHQPVYYVGHSLLQHLVGGFSAHPPVDVADSQFHQGDIPNYWRYASTYTLDDGVFSPVNGPTFPNHLFTIAGQDGNATTNPVAGDARAFYRFGCDASPGSTVPVVGPTGKQRFVFPCFDFTTLGDVLDRHRISWKYYAPPLGQQGYIFNAFDAIKHIRNGPDWPRRVFPTAQFRADATAGALPAVSWLVPPWDQSDHPPRSICAGENWTVRQINAIMGNAKEWAQTAIIVTWDDYGGFYDHVPPPPGPNPFLGYGPRVPMLILSPYAKPHFIDHTTYSFPSFLKFVEESEGLPSTHGMDAHASDLTGSFDFSQKPLPPLLLKERNCPLGLPLRPGRRTVLLLGLGVVAAFAVVLVLTVGFVTARSAGIRDRILAISPRLHVVTALLLVALGIALAVYVFLALRLPVPMVPS